MTQSRNRGFTLLEVLVALGIVAVISILSWQGLQEVLRSANRVTEVDERIQTTDAIFGQFEQDLAALELTLNSTDPQRDLTEITGQGLLLQFTQRNTSEPAYRERVEWVLENQRLLRIARNEINPEQPSVSEPLPMLGMQIRMWREPGGWSTPVFFGQVQALQGSDLNLQGSALQINSNNVVAAPPVDGNNENAGGAPATPDTPQSTGASSLVRAVEISLTQTNQQTLRRVFLTGGVY